MGDLVFLLPDVALAPLAEQVGVVVEEKEFYFKATY
jgi:hypothetical protein